MGRFTKCGIYGKEQLRNKLWSKADTYLTNYPAYMSFKQKPIKSSNSIPDLKSLSILEDKIEFITNTKPGYVFGMKRFNDFIRNNLKTTIIEIILILKMLSLICLFILTMEQLVHKD